jgi:hypothetical protein
VLNLFGQSGSELHAGLVRVFLHQAHGLIGVTRRYRVRNGFVFGPNSLALVR